MEHLILSVVQNTCKYWYYTLKSIANCPRYDQISEDSQKCVIYFVAEISVEKLYLNLSQDD